MLRDEKEKVTWWCCKADFGEHELSCKNYKGPVIHELDSPSEFIAVKECDCKEITGAIYKHCTHCNGTGSIRRQLTNKEALEIFYAMADGDAERELYYSQDGGKIFMMWNGERIERRKE
jgi:hypothetical protein